MAKPAAHPHPFVSRISLVGKRQGMVKALGGFRKQHHTVPDAVNAATSAFFARLCAPVLADEAEQLFQRARTIFGYKRTDLNLEVASPVATLVTRDFSFELAYALDPADPSRYESTRTLHSLRDGALVERPEVNELFANQFAGITFGLTKGVRVEAVIDAVEGQEGKGGLTVTYPSDCEWCVLAVAGVAAEVICDGVSLELRFSHPLAPRELVEGFIAVRSAFVLAGNRVLAGLL